ncbi:IS3 family transposase [Streptomyces sp. NPDC086989]|uniref:IS3 family transposase n=1 Tax=Streptomyces sp. NPDC086989 TaxID=3365764 RepID=UPI0037F56EA9
MHAELRGFGHTVNRKRVERLMGKHRLEGRLLTQPVDPRVRAVGRCTSARLPAVATTPLGPVASLARRPAAGSRPGPPPPK